MQLSPDTEVVSERAPPVIHAPINVRSTSLAILALIAVIGLLHFARAVFIPVTIALLASCALTPEVLKTLLTRPLFVMRLDVASLQIVGMTPGGYRRRE